MAVLDLRPRHPPRVAIVLEHPAQHFIESFRHAALSKRIGASVVYWTENKDGQFDVEFGRQVTWDVDLLSGYPWQRPSGESLRARAFDLFRVLGSLKPDVVVCFGWGNAVSRLTALWCFIRRVPILFYGDTTWQHTPRSVRERVRRSLLRLAFRLSAGALSTGTFNREFYIQLGMRPERIFESVCPIDVATYSRARKMRRRRGKEVTVVGFAGKLIRRKGVDVLLNALRIVGDEYRWEARIVGDGPERVPLQELSNSLGLADRVCFAGFRNTTEMPSELAAMDVVVVPSTKDMRVLVATEAMTAGAAVVVSSNTAIWGRGDLVEDGVTGRVFRSGNPTELAAILCELIANLDMRTSLQSAGVERAARQGPEAFTKGLEHAAEAVIGG